MRIIAILEVPYFGKLHKKRPEYVCAASPARRIWLSHPGFIVTCSPSLDLQCAPAEVSEEDVGSTKWQLICMRGI